MVTKNLIFKSITILTLAVFLVSGCKKKEDPAPPVTPTAEGPGQTQRASDQSNVDNESSQAMDEANTAMLDVSTTRDMQTSCDMVIDSSQKLIGKITLNYNGTVCNGKTRTGSIIIQLPYDGNTITTWSTAGATATLTFVDYKVTYVSNNKSVKFNGTHSIKNVNGGGLLELYLGTPIIHKVRANMQLSFDDGTSRTWKAAKVRTFTYLSGVIKATVAGDTTVNTYSSAAMWGTTRLGESFTMTIPTSVNYYLYGSTCLYKPTGQVVLYVESKNLTITYGVDANGTVITSGCPFGYKLNWTDSQGAAQQLIIAY